MAHRNDNVKHQLKKNVSATNESPKDEQPKPPRHQPRWFDEFTFQESPEQALRLIDDAIGIQQAKPDHRTQLLILFLASRSAGKPIAFFARGVQAMTGRHPDSKKNGRWGNQQHEDEAKAVIRAVDRSKPRNGAGGILQHAEEPAWMSADQF